MQMRVSLARAIITQPRLLLLDEPFASLDEMIKAQLQKLLLDLNKTYGMTMVMITHAVWDAALFATDAIIMRPKEVVEILPLSGETGEDAKNCGIHFYKPMPKISTILPPLFAACFFLVLWQALIMVLALPPYLVPSPIAVW